MNKKKMNQKKSRRWFRAQRVHVPVSLRRLASVERAAAAKRSGDPMLVLNMSIFNSGSSWNRIFNPVPQRENVWC
jgi:hypothetical protein